MPGTEPSWTPLATLPCQNPDMLSPRWMNGGDPAQDTDSWRSGSIGGMSEGLDEHELLASTIERRKERKRLLFVGILIARYKILLFISSTFFNQRES